MEQFKMKDLSNDVSMRFLGLEIQKSDTGITITQKELTNKIIDRFNIRESKPAAILIEPKLMLKAAEGENLNLPYKQLIGCLMYM